MERLAYTTQKTSDKQIKKGKFSVKLDLFTIIGYAKDVAIGFVIGIGSFLVMLSTFGLRWSHYDWPNGSFSGGMIETWNIVARHLAAVDGVFSPQLEGADGENGFFLAMVLLFFIAIGVAVSLSKNKWFIIFYLLLVGLPSIIWGAHPSVLAVAVLAAGILLLVVNSDVPNLSQNYRSLIYSVVVAAIAFVLMCIPALGSIADRPQAIDNFRENTQTKAMDSYYGTNPLHNGNLMKKTRGHEEGTALEVSMTSPDSLYLRGFVGDVLQHDGWEPLSSATYYQDKDLFYWLEEYGFNGLGQIAQSTSLASRGGKDKLNTGYVEEANEIVVENIDANKKYAYIPYEISIDGVDATKNWGDSFLTGGKLRKVKEYTLSASPNAVSTWTKTAAKFFTNKATVPEQKEYLVNESHYNNYIYQKFTYISKHDREILTTVLGDKGDQKRGHVEYNTAVKHVKQLVATNLEYTDKLKGYKKGRSALENIFIERNGYDAQLATAAVMMFRYYGIPARYVEGYLITQDDVASGVGVIDVPRKNAHAWAEIYVDGIGFVPVEVCPDYAGLMKEADYNVGISTQDKKYLTDKSKINEEDPNVAVEKNKTNAGGKKIPTRILAVLGILLGLAILALLINLVRRLIKKISEAAKRKKLFKTGEPREAVRAMYQRMDEKNIVPDKESIDIGNRASYSIMSITEEDRQTMLGKLKTLKKSRSSKVDKLKIGKPKIGKSKAEKPKKEKGIAKWKKAKTESKK